MASIEELQSKVDRIEGVCSSLKEREETLEKEVKDLKKEGEILNKSSLVLKHLLDIMVKDDIDKMADLVTYGLKTIFDDQDLSFKPVLSKRKDKINIDLKTCNGDIEGEFGSFGGSVAVIESFILRLLCILKMKLAKFVMLDETFAAVGDVYIPNTSKLISELSKKLNMDVLLVTHQREFLKNANTAYQVKESPDGLKMERII